MERPRMMGHTISLQNSTASHHARPMKPLPLTTVRCLLPAVPVLHTTNSDYEVANFRTKGRRAISIRKSRHIPNQDSPIGQVVHQTTLLHTDLPILCRQGPGDFRTFTVI
jgi:hypothetical protein